MDESGKDPFTGNWYAAQRVEDGSTSILMVTVTVKEDVDGLTTQDYMHAELLVARALDAIKKELAA